MLFVSKNEMGQGARRRCSICNFPINVKATGRTAKFCSATCRDTARRNANFEISGRARYPHQGEPRNPEKTPTISTPKIGLLANRAPAIRAPIVAIGLGCCTDAQPPERSSERAALIRNAIRAELAARWSRGLR
jgi:hypothetical protein